MILIRQGDQRMQHFLLIILIIDYFQEFRIFFHVGHILLELRQRSISSTHTAG